MDDDDDKEMAATAATPELLQLWALARVLLNQGLVQQAVQCLEAMCTAAASSGTASDEERHALLCANVLLAEVYLVACSNSHKAKDRELWRRRLLRAEKSVANVETALQQGASCTDEWRLRLFKAKLLLAQTSKAERAVKNQCVLEVLCSALQLCAKTCGGGVESSPTAELRKYFGVKLKVCLVKMYSATMTARVASHEADSERFLSSLRYLRANLSNGLDREFLLWLVEVSCLGVATAPHLGTDGDAEQLVQFGDELFQSVKLERVLSPDFHLYHLILRGFFFLRTGDMKKVAPLLDEIHAITLQQPANESSSGLKEAYLDTIVNALRLNVVACTDPCEALTLSMAGIHAAQSNLRKYEAHPAVRVLLIATLLDMLHLHCRLQSQQCRYFEMGTSIVQMLEIFAAYKAHLLPTVYYRFFLGRIHLLIAKYAVAIGRVKEACSHLNYVVNKLLPSLTTDTDACPDLYLSLWVGALEVGTCCSASSVVTEANEGEEDESDSPASPALVKQIYPSKVLLEWTARILEREKLRDLVYGCCNADLRAKYDLALCKWLWATQELAGLPLSAANGLNSRPLTAHASLEALRPTLASLLRETLERTSARVNCCETTAEIMALFGPKLIGLGRADSGEETLKNAVRLGLHSKNVLLQTRLLVDILRLYERKRHVQAQVATAARLEKKAAVLSRRVAAAQAEASTHAVILRWTSGATVKAAAT